MNTITVASAWRLLIQRYHLSAEQEALFKRYVQLLQQANQRINLTAITDERDIVQLHFDDSLALTLFYDFSSCAGCADIGAGGGFPGIPLKIMMPHLPVFLLEVSQKKRAFLQQVVTELHLGDVHIIDLDWRTFLRKTQYPIDLFCARASLPIDELMRMFKPSSPYNTERLVYWAARYWRADKRAEAYIQQQWSYKSAGRDRRLVLFGATAGKNT